MLHRHDHYGPFVRATGAPWPLWNERLCSVANNYKHLPADHR